MLLISFFRTMPFEKEILPNFVYVFCQKCFECSMHNHQWRLCLKKNYIFWSLISLLNCSSSYYWSHFPELCRLKKRFYLILLTCLGRNASNAARTTPSGPQCRTASGSAWSAAASTAAWACTSPSCVLSPWTSGRRPSSTKCWWFIEIFFPLLSIHRLLFCYFQRFTG